ncbi:hypothetical protein DM02DRAFT_657123 [Periconia macrospinosa]|uniref:F-box domain-containing protein n=1 Tax=Periconia macrospinosa TaxID=97972 RepID=A0A2V1DL81_9PLEO|nr:hypothetical protein DM02DRAFT_657123 [Periconia macrospinosa]
MLPSSNASQPGTSKPPRPSLLTIPRELRLRIYEFVLCTVLMHVWNEREEGTQSSFRWKPCLFFNSESGFCIKPLVTSGYRGCAENDTWPILCCTLQSRPLSLLKTCKAIRSEMSCVLFQYSNLSINIGEMSEVIRYLQSKGVHRPNRILLCGTFNDTNKLKREQLAALRAENESKIYHLFHSFPTLRRATVQIRCFAKYPKSWRKCVDSFDGFEKLVRKDLGVSGYPGRTQWMMGSRVRNVRVQGSTNLIEFLFDRK